MHTHLCKLQNFNIFDAFVFEHKLTCRFMFMLQHFTLCKWFETSCIALYIYRDILIDFDIVNICIYYIYTSILLTITIWLLVSSIDNHDLLCDYCLQYLVTYMSVCVCMCICVYLWFLVFVFPKFNLTQQNRDDNNNKLNQKYDINIIVGLKEKKKKTFKCTFTMMMIIIRYIGLYSQMKPNRCCTTWSTRYTYM